MVEYHVDNLPNYEDRLQHPLGGGLSARRNFDKKPVVILGQDECIFKQYSFTHSSWKHPDGTTSLIPKDDGQGVMISAFCSRKFGFGMVAKNVDLHRINLHQAGKKYLDEEAAKAESLNLPVVLDECDTVRINSYV